VARPYGSNKLNRITDVTTHDQNDTLTAQSIQLCNTPAQRIGGDTQVSAHCSRIGFETSTPVNEKIGELNTLVEIDFAGQNTSLTTRATSSSYTSRLRRAYAEFGTPIEWMSDWSFAGTGDVRQGHVRRPNGLSNGLRLSFAIESPYGDVTTTSGTSFPDSNGGGSFGWQRSPDFTARALFRQD
jgi:hypothetical protein